MVGSLSGTDVLEEDKATGRRATEGQADCQCAAATSASASVGASTPFGATQTGCLKPSARMSSASSVLVACQPVTASNAPGWTKCRAKRFRHG